MKLEFGEAIFEYFIYAIYVYENIIYIYYIYITYKTHLCNKTLVLTLDILVLSLKNKEFCYGWKGILSE